MKKLKQGLLLAVLLLLGAYVTIPLIKQEGQLGAMMSSTSCTTAPGMTIFTPKVSLILTAMTGDAGRLPGRGRLQTGHRLCACRRAKPALYESPLFRAETGDPVTEVWYGIGGIEAQDPQLILMLKEQNPRCRVLELDGAEHRVMAISRIFPSKLHADRI